MTVESSISEWIVQNLAPALVGFGGVFGAIVLRLAAPKIAGFTRRHLDRLLGWIQGIDDTLETRTGVKIPGWAHETWDALAGAVVGTVQQLAGDSAVIAQVFRILRGKPDLRRDRLTNLLQDHINQPDFTGIVKERLPEDLRELWNEASEALAVKTLVAKTGAEPETVKAVVKNIAPAAEVEAARLPPPIRPPMRSPEIQAEIERLRAKVKAEQG